MGTFTHEISSKFSSQVSFISFQVTRSYFQQTQTPPLTGIEKKHVKMH